MAITNFQSFVGVTSAGTGDVDKMAAAFDKLSASIDKTNEQSKKVSEHPGFDQFASKVKHGIEDPLGAAGEAVEGLLKSLGPAGAVVAGGAAIFTGFAVAGFEAAKALGEYATQIQNVSVRTGLSTKEVQQFSFAAKVVSQDVSIFEGSMRGLTKAVTEQSDKGETARKRLREFGIDVQAVRDGSASTADTMLRLSEGLSGISNTMERNRAGMEIFKKQWLELAPALLGLTENYERAKALGFGVGPEDLAKWEAYHKKIVEVETQWDELSRKLKAGVAIPVMFVIQTVSGLSTKGSAQGQATGSLTYGGENAYPPLTGPVGIYAPGGGLAIAEAQAAGDRAKADAIIRGIGATSGLEGQLKLAEKKLSGMEAPIEGVTDVIDAQRYAAAANRVEMLKKEIEATKQLAEEKKRLVAIDIQAGEAFLGAGAGRGINADVTRDLAKLGGRYQAALAQNPNSADAINRDFATEFYALTANNAAKLKENASKLRDLLYEADTIGKEAEAHLDQAAKKAFDNVRETGILSNEGLRPPGMPGYISPGQQLRDARDAAQRGLSLYGAQANLAGVSPVAQLMQLESMRRQFADEEYAALKRKADLTGDEAAQQDAIDQKHQKYLDAELETQQGLLALAQKRKDDAKALGTGLFDAALGGGAGLQQFFTNMLKQQAGLVAGNIFGEVLGSKSLNLGLPGKIFQGTMFGQDPLKDATMQNTLATVENTAALRSMALSATGGGGGLVRGAGSFGGAYSDFGGGSGIYSGGQAGTGDFGDIGGDYSGFPTGQSPGSESLARAAAGPGGSSNLGRYVGAGAAIAGGGAAIYSGINAGGAQGGLTAAGGAVGVATGIISLASKGLAGTLGPIGMAIGMGLGLISTFLGDPKVKRANELALEATSRHTDMPTGTNYSTDLYGSSVDMDYRGGTRFSGGTHNYYISAVDAPSFESLLKRNPGGLASGIAFAVNSGNAGDMVSSIKQA